VTSARTSRGNLSREPGGLGDVKLIRDVSRVSDSAVLLMGVTAGLLTSLFLFALDVAGWNHVSYSLLLGNLLSGRTDTFGVRVGFSAHLALSAVYAWFYSLVFRSARRSGIGVGLHVALFHWIIMGLAVSLMPWLTRTIQPETTVVMSPGPFALWAGLEAAISFFWSHLLFGSVIGLLFDRAAIGFDHPRPIGPVRAKPQRELSRSHRVSGTMRA
jgi:hypothetical protein